MSIKKIFMASLVLTTFSIALLLFEASCKKDATAQPPNYVLPPATTTRLGGVIVDGVSIQADPTGKISTVNSPQRPGSIILYSRNGANGHEIWRCNIDGSNRQKINIVMPAGYVLNVNGDGGQIRLTPDNQKIIFKASGPNTSALFSCSITGDNVVKLFDESGFTSFEVN